MKRMIPFLALAILFACSSNKVPSWVLHPDKQPKDMFFTVGSGDTEIEALCLSLADLAQRLHADIDSSYPVTSLNFGKIKISSLSQSLYSDDNTGGEEEHFSMSIKILYKDGDKRLILKYFIEKKIPINGSLINSEINKFFISAGENISWRDLTDELEENHIYIQSYYLLNQYYVQAKLDSKYTYYIPEKNDKFKNEQEDLNIKEKFEELMKEMQENK